MAKFGNLIKKPKMLALDKKEETRVSIFKSNGAQKQFYWTEESSLINNSKVYFIIMDKSRFIYFTCAI